MDETYLIYQKLNGETELIAHAYSRKELFDILHDVVLHHQTMRYKCIRRPDMVRSLRIDCRYGATLDMVNEGLVYGEVRLATEEEEAMVMAMPDEIDTNGPLAQQCRTLVRQDLRREIERQSR